MLGVRLHDALRQGGAAVGGVVSPRRLQSFRISNSVWLVGWVRARVLQQSLAATRLLARWFLACQLSVPHAAPAQRAAGSDDRLFHETLYSTLIDLG